MIVQHLESDNALVARTSWWLVVSRHCALIFPGREGTLLAASWRRTPARRPSEPEGCPDVRGESGAALLHGEGVFGPQPSWTTFCKVCMFTHVSCGRADALFARVHTCVCMCVDVRMCFHPPCPWFLFCSCPWNLLCPASTARTRMPRTGGLFACLWT